MLRRIEYVLAVILLLCGVTSFKCKAEESQWTISNTVTLQKAIFNTSNSLTVMVGEDTIAHEYELYMLIEEELEDNMGAFVYNGKYLYILGIMTIVPDENSIVDNKDGTFFIKEQTMYFGNNEVDLIGKTVYIGVESLDEAYNSSYSNLLEMNVKEGNNEVILEKGNTNKGNNSNSSTSDSNNSGLLVGGVVGLAAIGGSVAYFVSKSKRLKGKKLKKLKEQKERLELSIKDRDVYVWSKSDRLKKALKARPFLKVKTLEKDEIDKEVEEDVPDLLIMDIDDKETFKEVLNKKEDSLKECPLALNVDDDLLTQNEIDIKKAKDEKKIVSYASSNDSIYTAIVKLILPILKPDLKSDEALEDVGAVADLLGIPGISTAINVYIAGKDLKENLKESEIGVSEGASIIYDIASILGLDTLESMAGLVYDVESIKEVVNKDAGANEAKGAIEGAKDIVDVVKDITNK